MEPVLQSNRDAARFFDRFAAQFDTLYDGQRGPLMRWVDRRFRSDMFIRFALTFDAFGELAGKTVADIGCGSGPYLAEALRRGAEHVTGVDPAQGMLDIAREKTSAMSSRVTLLSGTFPGIDLEKHDFAIVMGVMDYVENAQEFMNALRSVVRNTAAISFPSRHWLRTPVREVRYRLRRCPLFFYDPDSISRLAREAGFKDVQIYKIPGAGMDYHVCLRP